MRRAYLLAIPLLLLLEVAAEIERQAHEAEPAQRVRTFLASDIGVVSLILLLTATGISGLLVIR
jgi:hypothetical protein